MDSISDLTHAFAAVRLHYQCSASEQMEHKRLRPRSHYVDPEAQSGSSRNTVRGDVLLQRIRARLSEIPLERSDDQKRFHEEFLRAVAPGLYGDQFEIEYKRILAENHWESVRPQALVITPRRWGKTYCVAMFIVAYLLSVPRSVQCVFSTSKRVSEKMLELIYKLFSEMPGLKRKIIKHTTETLEIAGDEAGDTRSVSAYPSNERIWVMPRHYARKLGFNW